MVSHLNSQIPNHFFLLFFVQGVRKYGLRMLLCSSTCNSACSNSKTNPNSLKPPFSHTAKNSSPSATHDASSLKPSEKPSTPSNPNPPPQKPPTTLKPSSYNGSTPPTHYTQTLRIHTPIPSPSQAYLPSSNIPNATSLYPPHYKHTSTAKTSLSG